MLMDEIEKKILKKKKYIYIYRNQKFEDQI